VSAAVASSLAFAAGAGIATFLSPCALPLVPGYVGYYVSATDGDAQAGGLVLRAIAVALGVVVALGGLAGLAVAVGRPFTRSLSAVEPLVGVALAALGVLVVTNRSPDWHVPFPERRVDTAGFVLFGVGYGTAAAGCVLPVFLAVVVQALALPPTVAAAVVGAYAGSVALPLLAVTVAVGTGTDVATDRLAASGDRIESLAGIVLVLAGLGQVAVAVDPTLVPALPFGQLDVT
jgi:cytochrome c-type biogenesis protein